MSEYWTKMYVYPDPEITRYREADDINVDSTIRMFPRPRSEGSYGSPSLYLETIDPSVVDKLKHRNEARLINNGHSKACKYTMSLPRKIELDEYLEELSGQEVYLDPMTEGVTTMYYGKKLKWK